MMEEVPVVVNRVEDRHHHHHQPPLDLPPGFRFHPTDEEIITHYLTEKVLNSGFSATAIGEADLNKCEPWDLPKKAKMGEKEWYFFCQRDRKYPTGMRTNRATVSGYWKATGKDKEIFKGKGNLVGMKKTLVFYTGRAPKGEKSNWVMHEFRLEGKFATHNLPKPAKEEWVVSRVFHKNSTDMKKMSPNPNSNPNPIIHPSIQGLDHEDLFDCSSSLPPLMDDYDFKGTARINSITIPPSSDGYNYYLPNFSNNNIQQSHPQMQFIHNQPTSVSSTATTTSFQQNQYYYRCKMEPLSSSTNTTGAAVSNDRNTDASSVVSNHKAFYGGGGDPNPLGVGPLSDLEGLWDDY